MNFKNNNAWTNNIQKILLLIVIILFCIIFLDEQYIKKYKNRQRVKMNSLNILTPQNNNLSESQVDQSNRNDYMNINLSNEKLYWKNKTSFNISEIKSEIQNYKNKDMSFENISDFYKRKNPKISLVISVHNNEKNIKLIYTSIQNQELKDIEIIFVDDASKDNTSFIINELKEKDKRILHLKNDINKRAFYSRNKGILEAKGEYVLVIDPDDLLVNNILIKAYETAKLYNLDIVQFYVLRGFYDYPDIWRELKYKDGILKNNTEIRNNFYDCISRNLWDKLVKRDIYIKSINFMKKEFYNQIYCVNNDDTAFFGLIHVANTFGFLEEIGYFYITRPAGQYYYRHDPKNMNIIFRSIFNNMKYFYIQSDNNTLEKNNLAYKYLRVSLKEFEHFLSSVTLGFDFFFGSF